MLTNLFSISDNKLGAMASTLGGYLQRNRKYFSRFKASTIGLRSNNFETVKTWQQIADRIRELLEEENHNGIAMNITEEELNPPREVTLFADESLIITIKQNPAAEKQARIAREQEKFQKKLRRIERLLEVDELGCMKKAMKTNLRMIRMMNRHQKTTKEMYWSLTETLEHRAFMAQRGLPSEAQYTEALNTQQRHSVEAGQGTEDMETDEDEVVEMEVV